MGITKDMVGQIRHFFGHEVDENELIKLIESSPLADISTACEQCTDTPAPVCDKCKTQGWRTKMPIKDLKTEGEGYIQLTPQQVKDFNRECVECNKKFFDQTGKKELCVHCSVKKFFGGTQ